MNTLLQRFAVFSLLACLPMGCTSTRCCTNLYGADEFVMDSYLIRQGKMAILEMEGEDQNSLPSNAMEEFRDTIADGDVLKIVVYHPSRKDLTEAFQFVNDKIGGFRVYKGAVELPDLESVHVEGLTLDEAREAITDQLDDQIQNATVFIKYIERSMNKVDLTGMVGVSSIPVDGRLRLYDVLAQAKVNPSANLFMSHVSRRGEQLPIDLNRLITASDMSQNIVMHGGDKVFIANPNDATVTVMGEVSSPTAVNVTRGSISLREALVAARGIPFTGDRSRIQIIRGNLQDPKIYVLSWEHIIHLPNDSLLLMPGDTIYVSETPITQWNRFIQQLIPTVQAYRDFGDARLKNRY